MMLLKILPLLLLVGCGALAEKEEPTQTDFLMVSMGKASLLYSVFMGGVEYCKITKHGIQHDDFAGSIEHDGKSCKVLIEAAGN